MLVDTKELKKELEYVSRFTESKPCIPILQNCLMSAKGGKLLLACTDLEVAGMSSIIGKAEDEDDEWSTVAPINIIKKYLIQVEEATLRINPLITKSKRMVKRTDYDAIEKKTTKTEVEEITETHRLRIRNGDNGDATFDGMEPSAFPVIPVPTEIYGVIHGIVDIVKKTDTCISAEESRFTLNGALLKINEQGSAIVSTDGHRISYLPINCDPIKPYTGMIRADALRQAVNLPLDKKVGNDSIMFGANDDFHVLCIGSRSIVSRKLTGNFPDYERVIPKESDYWRHISLPVSSTIKMLKRVGICADQRSKCTSFNVHKHDILTVIASSEGNSAEGKVPIEWPDIPLRGWTCGLNYEYVLDFLNHATGGSAMLFCPSVGDDGVVEKALEFYDDASKWRYIVMPMRIN